MSDAQRAVNLLLLFADEDEVWRVVLLNRSQAIVDAVLDYLECKDVLLPTHHGSLLERIMRLRERAGWDVADTVWSARSDDGDWSDWDKKH